MKPLRVTRVARASAEKGLGVGKEAAAVQGATDPDPSGERSVLVFVQARGDHSFNSMSAPARDTRQQERAGDAAEFWCLGTAGKTTADCAVPSPALSQAKVWRE
jgi:hypothetical protein